MVLNLVFLNNVGAGIARPLFTATFSLNSRASNARPYIITHAKQRSLSSLNRSEATLNYSFFSFKFSVFTVNYFQIIDLISPPFWMMFCMNSGKGSA